MKIGVIFGLTKKTLFLQRKVIVMRKEEYYAKMDSIIGYFYIEEYLDILEEDIMYKSYTNYERQSPDDFSL